MADMNNEWKVQLGAELKSGVKKEIQDQLDTFKDLKIDVNKASLGQNIASSVQKQLDKLSINLNIGKINIGNNIKGLSKQVSSQLKSGLGNPLQIFKVSDLQKNGVAYMTKVSKTINKQMAEIQKMANAQGWQDFNVTGIEKADGKIKSLTMTVTDATGALKQLNFQREYIETNTGNKHLGLVQTEDVKIIKTAAQAEKEFIQALDKAKTKADEINRNAVQDLKYDIDTKAFETDMVTLENHLKKFRDVTEQSQDEVVKSFYETKAAYEQLVATMQPNSGTDDATKLKYLDQYQKALEKTNNYVKQLRSNNKNTPIEIGDEKRINLINKLNNYIANNTAMTKENRSTIEQWISVLANADNLTIGSLQAINSQFKTLDTQLRQTGQLGLSWSDKFAQAWEKFGGWSIATGTLTILAQLLRKIPQEVRTLDDVITDFTMATGANEEQIKSLITTYGKLGEELKATVNDVTVSATEWLKQGKTIAETEMLIKAAMALSKVGKLSSAESTKYLTSVMKSYKVSVEDTMNVVDKLSAVDMASATDVGGLAEGISTVANNARLAGVSMDKLLGYLSSVGEVSQEGMSGVGTAFNAIFARMGNIKLSRLKDYETGEDLSNVETVLRGVGISLRDTQNSFRNFDEVLDETASRWTSFSEVQQRAIANAFAGTHHVDSFVTLMENYDNALKYSEISMSSSGDAMKKFEAYQDSLAGHTEALHNSFIQLSDTLLDEDIIKFFLDLGTIGTDSLNSIVKAATPLGTLGTVLGGFLGAKNLGWQIIMTYSVQGSIYTRAGVRIPG